MCRLLDEPLHWAIELLLKLRRCGTRLELTADIRRIVTIKPGFLTGPEIAAVLKASFGDDRTRLLQANYSARLRVLSSRNVTGNLR